MKIEQGHIRAAFIAALILWSPISIAETHALVIGIDLYHHGISLHGAVNDARDIADTLKHSGVTDLTLLLNDKVTRDRIISSWNQKLQRSHPGDLIIFSYAGHGSQEPERIVGSEEDGQDEVLLLGGFQEDGPSTRERIIDDELNQWFVDAGNRGVDVLFIADTCHSGTLTRGYDSRVSNLSVRYSPYEISDDMLELDLPPDAAKISNDDLPNVTFLAAGQEYQKVPEILAPDSTGRRVKRGALSYAVSRALEGDADSNRDGKLTRGELQQYVRESVRMLSEARQTPNLLPKGGDEKLILELAPSNVPEFTNVQIPSIQLKIIGMSQESIKQLIDSMENAVRSSTEETPDLIFDNARGQVISAHGDVVARNISESTLGGVVDKWHGLHQILSQRITNRLRMQVTPHDGLHRAGDKIGFTIADILYPYLAIFSLSGDGTVHFHYPLAGEAAKVDLGQPVRYDFMVTEPFGADHIVAITSDRPLDGLIANLKPMDGLVSAGLALGAVMDKIKGQFQIGIQGFYTSP